MTEVRGLISLDSWRNGKFPLAWKARLSTHSRGKPSDLVHPPEGALADRLSLVSGTRNASFLDDPRAQRRLVRP
jgi:hypothetical protein